MTELPEQRSPKAARILAAAGELLLSRGSKAVTIADVAQRAYVGKGTVYLYWATKEELLLGLIAREFLAIADDLITALSAEPDLARPSRFGPLLMRAGAKRPLVAALQNHDDGLLGMLADDPRAGSLRHSLGPSAVLDTVLPSWRRNGLATADWELADQALALHAFFTGFGAAINHPPAQAATVEHAKVFAASITALLGAERATADQIQASATDIIEFLTQVRRATVEAITRPGAKPTA